MLLMFDEEDVWLWSFEVLKRASSWVARSLPEPPSRCREETPDGFSTDWDTGLIEGWSQL
tara:strand:+ start:3612 stop:3791 length:180 start_codon:yes stop_codon:yes gene_type:complete